MGQPNPFTSPAPPGAPDPAPRPRDLSGCLVAYAPKIFTPAGAPGNDKGLGKSEPRDRVTADLIVLEIPQGIREQFQTAPGLVLFGGSPDWEQDPKPHYLSVAAPARFENVWIGNTNMVRFALAPGGVITPGQLVLGRIVRSTFGQKPFNLESVDGTPDMDKAVAIYTALQLGQATFATPQPIPGAPVPQRANSVTTAGPAMPPGSVNYGYAPSPTPPAPTAWMGAQPPQLPAPTAPPTRPTPQQDPAYAAYLAQQQQAQAVANVAQAFPGAVPIPQPPAPPTPDAPAPLPPHLTRAGWTPETWGPLTTEQKSQVLASTPLT